MWSLRLVLPPPVIVLPLSLESPINEECFLFLGVSVWDLLTKETKDWIGWHVNPKDFMYLLTWNYKFKIYVYCAKTNQGNLQLYCLAAGHMVRSFRVVNPDRVFVLSTGSCHISSSVQQQRNERSISAVSCHSSHCWRCGLWRPILWTKDANLQRGFWGKWLCTLGESCLFCPWCRQHCMPLHSHPSPYSSPRTETPEWQDPD